MSPDARHSRRAAPRTGRHHRRLGGLLGLWLSGLWLLGLLTVLSPAALATTPLPVDAPSGAPLGRAASFLAETGAPMTLEDARTALDGGRFRPLAAAVASFGIGHRPVWIHLRLENPTASMLPRQVLIGQTWLDRVDVHVLSPDRPARHYTVGDALTGMPGLAGPQGFRVEHAFPPGRSDLLIRVETPDPMVLNLRLNTADQAADQARQEYYGYGFLYGFLLSLAVYNLLLFVGIGRRVHLWYALYLLSFVALNIAYTGHGAYWLWSDWPGLQRYVILCLMVLMPYAGLRFARSFLELAQRAPRIDRWIKAGSGVALGAIAVATLTGAHEAAAWIAFVSLGVFIVAMTSLGIHAVRKGWGGAWYFLAAALASMLGAALTEFSVWGFLPFNTFTYHGMDFGMMLDATLLALALAYFVRLQMSQRERAEREARLDALTHLNNRRGFQEMAEAPFLVAVRHQRPLSALVIDIDHFKAINDRHGHAVGDKVLIEVAGFLSHAARRGDVLARWGGEEFILLLPETGLDEAAQLAERLRQMFQALAVSHGNRPLKLTASFGVASLAGQTSLMELIDLADQALYAAKAAGRNRVATAPPSPVGGALP